MTGDILINLDTEEEGEIYIGCAGGKGTKAYFHYKPKNAPRNRFWFKVSVKGLRGGHSGSDIDKKLGNANKLIARFLYPFTAGNTASTSSRSRVVTCTTPSRGRPARWSASKRSTRRRFG